LRKAAGDYEGLLNSKAQVKVASTPDTQEIFEAARRALADYKVELPIDEVAAARLAMREVGTALEAVSAAFEKTQDSSAQKSLFRQIVRLQVIGLHTAAIVQASQM